MKFTVANKVFEKMDDVCFGVIIVKNINNKEIQDEILNRLNVSIQECENTYNNVRVKELEEISYYRDAFRNIGINPNKYMSSIEAMMTRISKGKGLPSISPIVDLANSISLKYKLPLGAHDLDTLNGDIEVRFSKKGDTFIPLGSDKVEVLEDGELIYSAGEKVRTRRWIWRQSEQGKITEDSKNVFIPIDGFNKNRKSIILARDELAKLIENIFCTKVKTGFVDKGNPIFEIY